MIPTPKYAAIAAALLLSKKLLNRMSGTAPLKSSEIRELNDHIKELDEHAEAIKALDAADQEASGTDADGNPRSPLTGGTGEPLKDVKTVHGFDQQKAKADAEAAVIAQDPQLDGPRPVTDGTPIGQKPAAEVGGIPAAQSQDPQINITPVGTIDAPSDPQMPALITPPGEPFPSPAVVVVKEGDAPQEVVTPDGTLEETKAADTSKAPKPEAHAAADHDTHAEAKHDAKKKK